MIRIGTPGTHNAAYLAGVSGKAIPGPVKTVVINGQGRLGTSTAPNAAQLMAIIDKQQKEIDALRRDMRRR